MRPETQRKIINLNRDTLALLFACGIAVGYSLSRFFEGRVLENIIFFLVSVGLGVTLAWRLGKPKWLNNVF